MSVGCHSCGDDMYDVISIITWSPYVKKYTFAFELKT